MAWLHESLVMPSPCIGDAQVQPGPPALAHFTALSPVAPGVMADLVTDDVRSARRGETMDLKLSDKVVLVTGAGQGLGRTLGVN